MARLTADEKREKALRDMVGGKDEKEWNEVDRARDSLIKAFQIDMAILDPGRQDTYVTQKHNKLRFKYEYAKWVFKVWCAGWAHDVDADTPEGKALDQVCLDPEAKNPASVG